MSSKAPQPVTPQPVSSEIESFDQRLERLERIVAELEQGRIGLEQALERYQEGVGLLRSCRSTLDGFRKRVEELAESGALQPLTGEPDSGQSS
jgi:exodeoxyribonuclease VII small subunit